MIALIYLVLLLCGCASGYCDDMKILESFSSRSDSYLIDIHPKSDSAGATASWYRLGDRSKGALRLEYNFQSSASHCLWRLPTPDFTGEETAFSFSAKGRPGANVVVRILDSTGQYHQYKALLSSTSWERIRFAFKGAMPSHWGGANDGVMHMPVREILIGAEPNLSLKGALMIDEVHVEMGNEVVRIDLSKDEGSATHRASGFLHAMNAVEPDSSLVDPLKPRLLRMAAGRAGLSQEGDTPTTYDRVTRLGAGVQIVVSDSYGYGKDIVWPGDDGDWTRWEETIERLVTSASTKGYSVEWDVWNEPDIDVFWKRDRDRFFETWRRGVLKIRELEPDAQIVGPSLAWYKHEYLESFLAYCKAHNVLPDILCWHEMGPMEFDYKNIPSRVDYMRRFMARNGIHIDRFSINEIIGAHIQTNPGVTVWFFHALERAGVESAAHACWPDKDPAVGNCSNNSLDGLLTHPDRQPRSTWWVYKRYADITGRLVSLEPSAGVAGIAGWDSDAGEVRVLLGRDTARAGNVEVVISGLVSAPGLVSGGKIRAIVERIPDSGWETLPTPEVLSDREYPIEENELRFSIPDLGPSDACFVRLLRPE